MKERAPVSRVRARRKGDAPLFQDPAGSET